MTELAGTASADDTDGFFGLVVGLYAAAVAAPAVAIGVALAWTTDPGALFVALLGSLTLVAGVVGRVGRRETVAVRLGATRWVWAAVVPPLGYLASLLAWDALLGGSPPGSVAGLALVGALAGLAAGIGLVTASHNRHAKALLADSPPIVAFSARAPERDRTLGKWAAGSMLVVSAAGFVAGILLHADLLQSLFQILFPIAAGFYGSLNERELRVSSAGLVTGSPVHKRLVPWKTFESYDVTDEAIVVRRAGWSAWGLRDVRRDATEVEDAEAVASALGEFLPRHERPGRCDPVRATRYG
ncbi:hypothetical protein M0R88_11790 [Halorussus gelatinilyticus]|uniref:PH domain-containing protein n=1 Tax=Halorussus gelatinilyticus TaxID=2937524 RepID=A0A8U0IDS9_9EURY|nr:hypothetical protein [Halorussus gelatinilyticus]UPV99206.1 hypothetical protein M0R88_11790 [Halorussus gelatinilyticus]